MEMDDQNRSQQSLERGPQEAGRAWSFKLAALALTLISIAAATGFFVVPWLRPPGEAAPPADSNQPTAAERLFRNWPTPDVALLLTGQQYGYIQPCGCSFPQKGGLARRYNFVQDLVKKRGWQVVAADLGDVAQESGPQRGLKYEYSMKALNLMNYTAVGVGVHEALMPLFDALSQYALNNPKPRVLCANLIDKNNIIFPTMAATSEFTGGNHNVPRIGLIGVVGPSMAEDLQRRGDDDVRFEAAEKVLPKEIRALSDKQAELLVLLFLGTAREAKAYAAQFPQFQVILCWREEEQPSAVPDVVGNTLIIGIGHKGKHVGVVGVNRTGKADKPFDLRYELVEIGPEYETPEGQDATNPVHGLLEDYARKVRKDNYLAKYIKVNHPVQVSDPGATYVGSDKCRSCHKPAYEVWKAHPHSHAYQTLVNAKRPALRQFDGECVVCHTTGFGYDSGFKNEQETPKLVNVGCESCHGPASLHVKNPNNPQLREALNPFKARPGETPEKWVVRMHTACAKCHDEDNSVHFKFEEYWEKKKTVHNTPKEE